jgi:hypothetical protein
MARLQDRNGGTEPEREVWDWMNELRSKSEPERGLRAEKLPCLRCGKFDTMWAGTVHPVGEDGYHERCRPASCPACGADEDHDEGDCDLAT